MRKLDHVTLELSSKPFFDASEETMFSVGRKMFRQWKNLTDQAEKISLMLWIADGSEILQYSGNLDDTFEWAYWWGCAEPLPGPEQPTEREKRHNHWFPVKYRADASPRSYRWLKQLISTMRSCCQEINGKALRVVAIFDNGPEFCKSDFKYRWHNEICQGSTVGKKMSVVCNSTLHADHRRYAAYPEGIPEGLSLGSFLGSQFRCFARDLGYDAIWLSNGMGFGRDAWGITGFLFDKEKFYPQEAEHARETMLGFWRDFTSHCPGVEIETRGSNYSAGIELASDGAPLKELYDDFKIAPPVNSPWAALNFNSGLEIAAWMSHVAELPDERFPFRFYTHDPWFLNSPWLDRYGREPWDIYLPLSISRIDADGKTGIPTSINLLSVDDSYGNMPDQVPQEVTPHLLEAFRHAPDAAGPFVWVYPFRHYCEMVHGNDPHPETVFNEELFLGETIQAGFPLNTVVELANFRKTDRRAIAVIPVSAYNAEIEDFLQAGGKAIFYGALKNAPETLRNCLGLKLSEPMEGEVKMDFVPATDRFRHGTYPETLTVLPLYDDGGLAEIADGAEVLASAGDKVLASVCGNAAFVRSILPPQKGEKEAGFPVPALFRSVAAHFDWRLEFQGNNGKSLLPRMNVSRHDNGFFFSIFARDTTSSMKLRTPAGAPVLEEMETELTDGCALLHPPKCWHKLCRVFVDGQSEGVISCKCEIQMQAVLAPDSFSLDGLENATVRIFAPEEALSRLEFINGANWEITRKTPLPYEIEETVLGRCAVLRGISGRLLVCTLK